MPKSNNPFEEIDNMLMEVREMLTIAEDTSDINELVVLQLLLQLTKELHSITNVHYLITKVLDSALAFVDGERAFLMLLDEEGSPQFKMGRTADGSYLAREDFSPSTTVISEALRTGQTIIIPDAQADEELSKRASVQNLGLRTIICSPMMIKRVVIGLLYVDSQRRMVASFNDKASINFLASLADQSAVAIRNAQKFETFT
jgi:transcriptional regulator with GAF, ATPase, and Fis domain